MKFVEIFVVLFVVVVGGGTSLGLFFDWLGEKKADAEIRKHDKEVAHKIREKYKH